MNFLALLGWAPDGETTIMSARRAARALLARAGRGERGHLRLREARLDERRLPARAAGRRVCRRGWSRISASRATTGRTTSCGRPRRSSSEKIERLGQFPAKAGFLFGEVEPDPALLDRTVLDAAAEAFEALDAWDAAAIEVALKELCERLGAEAETGLPADQGGGDGVEGLAGPLREPRAARPRGVARARSGVRPRWPQRSRAARAGRAPAGTPARRGVGSSPSASGSGRCRSCRSARAGVSVVVSHSYEGNDRDAGSVTRAASQAARAARRAPCSPSRARARLPTPARRRRGRRRARERRRASSTATDEDAATAAWSCGETAAAVASSRWKARRTPNRAPRHSQTSGSAAAGPASSTTSAIWAVSSRAIASATCSSSWGSSRPSSGWIPSARSAATWSAYCRCGNSSSSSSCADGSAATDSRARRVGPSSRRR